ncbi:MAG: S8 family serine peptidase [Acidimicrobiia bacterium]|nr:S8 family serine peptidase [Acidimicrobiia bacterium]
MSRPVRGRIFGRPLLALAIAVPSAVALGLVPGPADADTPPEVVVDAPAAAVVEGFIVHLEPSGASDATVEAETEAAIADATTEDVEADVESHTATGAAVVSLSEALSGEEANAAMDELLTDPRVAAVEPDLTLQANFTPNDTRYAEQWDLFETTGGIRLPAAIDGAAADGAGAVVAVIDTGLVSHPDLAGQTVAGYDFITSATTANDGGGRDSDPSDPGDWNTSGQCGLLSPARNSSWHGTHVAGTIAAATGNGAGVVGIAPNADVQPVRVLGRCGGSTADIADAVIWASGGAVSGAPVNQTPADVINLSLGGSGSCGISMQNAINGARSRGTVVVVAAGNSNANADNSTPANCAGVVTVAATTRQGARAPYSNYGTSVEIAAPGGDTASGTANGILSTLNSGTQGPGTPTYAFYQGTSMATPHVAGVAALLRGERPNATVSEIETAMISTARAFPGTCSQCGSGILDANAALVALTGGPGPTTTAPPTTAPPTTAPPTTAPPTTAPPTTQPPAGQTFTNGTDYFIADKSTVNSPITSTRAGTAPSNLRVAVDIAHTYKGDLRVELIAPDGTVYLLHNRTGGSADNIITTYTVNASGRPAGGTWTLRVRDMANSDTGTLRAWSITFP